MLQRQQELNTPSLSRFCFGQGNLLCILHHRLPPTHQRQDVSLASSTQPCLPLPLPQVCSSQLPSKICPLSRLTCYLIYLSSPQAVPPSSGLESVDNNELATFTTYWMCVFLPQGLCAFCPLGSVWIGSRSPPSSILTSDPSASPCPGLSRGNAWCRQKGTGAHPLPEGRMNLGWNRPSLCFLFDENELSSHVHSTLAWPLWMGTDSLPGSVLSF